MYDDSVKLIEMPEHNSISVCVYIEQDGIFELGERINARFEEAYMNGYNWDALITFYVNSVDSELMKVVGTDPEAGMFAAYMSEHNSKNVQLMKKFEQHVRDLLADEVVLMQFIEDNFEAFNFKSPISPFFEEKYSYECYLLLSTLINKSNYACTIQCRQASS